MTDSTNKSGAERLVLVIEDDEDTRDTLRYALELNGFGTAGASDGRQAIQWLSRNDPPCLVLLDLMMPVMSGMEFLRTLRGDARLQDTPVVVVTAWPEEARRFDGAQAILAKPFELRDLLTEVRRLCC